LKVIERVHHYFKDKTECFNASPCLKINVTLDPLIFHFDIYQRSLRIVEDTLSI
jgi:hypothetical protein